ncbi:hypothetical protein EI94DRAFT_1705236 [Lactarius quietus]|nr:hypothetical protein EI94DRAFT_1705236 [Lactarius quietus]
MYTPMQCDDITGLEGDEDIYNDPLPPLFFNTADEDDTGFKPYCLVGTLRVPRRQAQSRPPFDFASEDNTIFEPLPMDTLYVPKSQARSRLPPVSDSSGDDDYGYKPFTADTLRVPKPQLRSRPPIDFSGQFSATPSLMSGLTLHPHLLAFPCKAASSIGLTSRLSPETIASLTDIDLNHNPIYCKLHRKYDYVSMVLAKYMDRDFEEKQVTKSELPLVPGIHQAAEQTLAHHRLWGQATQLPNIQNSTSIPHTRDIVIDKLVKLSLSRSHTSLSAYTQPASKLPTKSNIQKWFKVEYSEAIFELEAEQKLLHLCSGHWKADTMIGQAFLQHNDAECRWSAICTRAASAMPDPVQLHPGPAPIPQVSNLVPSNATKRSLELSPSPKSPSATHIQQHSRDATMISALKNTGPSALSNVGQHTVAHKITPQFLNHSVTIKEEPAPTNLHTVSPISVVPCVKNIIADLISQFPSLTNASSLITSMNSQPSFKQGEPSDEVKALLKCIQYADPNSPDINEDNRGQSWGHYQFMAGGLSPSSSLTTWQKIGSINTALKLVVAALKTCQDAQAIFSTVSRSAGTLLVGQAIASRIPVVPITPPHHNNAMSGFKIRLKLLPLNADNATTTAPEPPKEPPTTASTVHQQLAVDTELMQEPSVALHKGARADATSLKLLQIPELLARANDNKLTIPKLKRKDDIIAAIVVTLEFAQVSKSTIDQIIEQHKLKKALKQLTPPIAQEML